MTPDQLFEEKTRLAAKLAKIDRERDAAASELSDLETAERVFARFNGQKTGGRPRKTSTPLAEADPAPEPKRRGRPRKVHNADEIAHTDAPEPKRLGRPRKSVPSDGQPKPPTLSDKVLALVSSNPGSTTADLIRESGARPNHVGIALNRHLRGARLEQRGEHWFAPYAAA